MIMISVVESISSPPFLGLDWKLADEARTEPIRHFQDLFMDLLVGRATECLLIRRSPHEGGEGHSLE